ncbi:DoxX family membrane protein [Streptomyces sp. NBC_01003]|uniref:hypothetical protein n=1 Tax=Streptomyces sp. NBC_01003 TaxID=2903714 RepID=UPI00386AD073|nr:DoxX family membrane protein [Streptomyces sp. NBC_01003]
MPDRRPRYDDVARALARVALAAVFVSGGRHVWRHPDGPAQAAEPLLKRCRRTVPILDWLSDRQLVRVNAAVHVAAGVGLSVGRVPAVCATALAASLVPTTVAAFPFWEQPPGPQRAKQQGEFLKNAAMAGGLLAVALTDRTQK